MGRYNYICELCEHSFEVRHSAKEILHRCPKCETDKSLKKVMNITRFTKKVETKQKTGHVVNSTIEEIRNDIVEERKRLKSRKKK